MIFVEMTKAVTEFLISAFGKGWGYVALFWLTSHIKNALMCPTMDLVGHTGAAYLYYSLDAKLD